MITDRQRNGHLWMLLLRLKIYWINLKTTYITSILVKHQIYRKLFMHNLLLCVTQISSICIPPSTLTYSATHCAYHAMRLNLTQYVLSTTHPSLCDIRDMLQISHHTSQRIHLSGSVPCTMGIWAANIDPLLFRRLFWGNNWLIEANWGISWILEKLCFEGYIDKTRFF